ncbi:MAG: flavodoxin family protein [Firmicutes bacterium HGW-Firmicutes-14]|nr:MAG: flavodoxin family protein [Firmicutes bacterium HGW-Firmicutes-14]
MFILGLNGSPQKEGNTVNLINAALEAAAGMGAETRVLHVVDALKGVSHPFCTNCSPVCEGTCLKGSSLREAYDILSKTDGIIMGSPVYFGTVSAQLKAFWDKSRSLRKEKSLLNVIGGAVSAGAARFGGQETTVNAIHDIMFVQGMTVVGDGYFDNDAGHQGACAQKPSSEDENGLIRAGILGRRVAEVARATMDLRRR